MKKRYRLLLIIVLMAVGFYFLWPSIQWYFLTPQADKEVAESSRNQIKVYAQERADELVKRLVAMNADDPVPAAEALLDSARAKLLAVRNRRVWPGRGENILTGWNGLAVAGLAAAARTLDRGDFIESAARAVAFLREHCWYDGRLLAVHKEGRSR